MQKAKVAAVSWVHLYFSEYIVHNIYTGYLDCYGNLPTAVSVMKAGNPQRDNCILIRDCILPSHWMDVACR